MITISQNPLKLIKNLAILAMIISNNLWANDSYSIKNPQGNSVELKLALTKNEQTKGLSGLKPKEFKSTQGLLFVNTEMGPRRFWMPDTYFNLDIIFLDQDLKIVGLEKNVPAHPGLQEPPIIKKTEIYQAQYILETKAGSKFGLNLKVNDRLNFIGSTSLSEIILKIRQKQ